MVTQDNELARLATSARASEREIVTATAAAAAGATAVSPAHPTVTP